MTIPYDGHTRPKSRPGPKARGRTVVPLTITVTRAQRTALEAQADTEGVSISAIVRRFVAAGLATLIDIAIARRTGADARRAAKES